ncbi:ABC transporter ATP-binding protein [Paraliobacillus zengyii]|uniref:ABC transporter ATP-binding protein n=1 Tax=Paraliobacillus zengyii TaxID=2213194 RepID=UPI000DD4209A|nr:ABC transporter ATP-binding protein [Paraliobacillus zengyii]
MELVSVSKKYGKQMVLKEIDLELRKGVITGLIGKNGAGKTTIMKILCENIKNFEGSLNMDNHEEVGYLIEHPKAYKHKSGWYNLTYFSRIFTIEYDPEYVDFLIEALGMKNYIRKKVKNYSMGMKQRLGIAISMLSKPNYLILDEPTNGMDPDGSIEVLKTLKQLSEKYQIGVLISSHKLEDVEMISDEVVFIDHGNIKKKFETGDLAKSGVIKIGLQPEETEQAYAIISGLTEVARIEEEQIVVPFSSDLSQIIKELSKQEIYPINITKNPHSLKDYYFQMTQSGEVAQ